MCHQEIYRQEGGSVSDERVEKLVEKYAATVSNSQTFQFLTFDNEDRRRVFLNSPVVQNEMRVLRAALQEARREALKEAAAIVLTYKVMYHAPNGVEEYNGGIYTISQELGRLAGEEGTK
jgi:hypothetical protein